MAALLRFAARKVCSRATASLERPPQASFTATTSLAVVKELEQQWTLPWTILFHGRVSSLRWFSSSSESPDKVRRMMRRRMFHQLLRFFQWWKYFNWLRSRIEAIQVIQPISTVYNTSSFYQYFLMLLTSSQILAAQVEHRKEELRHLLRELDVLRTQKCAIAAREKEKKVSEKKKHKENKKLLHLLSLGDPLYQLHRHGIYATWCVLLVEVTYALFLTRFSFAVPSVGTLLMMILVILATLLVCEKGHRASKKRGQTPRHLPST